MRYFQLAIPGRIDFRTTIEDLEECRNLVHKFNGCCPLYRTLYDYKDELVGENAIVDKIFFDFDVDPKHKGRELEDTRKFHEYLLERNILHYPYFSGNGFHIIVKTKPIFGRTLSSPKTALRAAHTFLKDDAGVKPDPTTKDLMRICRLPGTLNLKTHLFNIPLLYEELYLPKSEIIVLARTQRLCSFSGGRKMDRINLLDYDSMPIDFEYKEPNVSIELNDEILMNELPHCVIELLKDGFCTYNQRFMIITALRDLCYTKEDTKKLLKRFLHPKKYRHCVTEENQVDYLYKRSDLYFPSCRTIKEDGLCVKNCPGQKIYLED